MAEQDGQEKTEQPTERKLQQARERGNIPKSNDVNSALILISASLFLRMVGPWMFKEIMQLFPTFLQRISTIELTQTTTVNLFRESFTSLGTIMLPFGACILAAGLIANYIQVGVLFTAQPLTPKLEKINPLSGFKRLLSPRSLMEAAKSIAKIGIVAVVAYITIRGQFKDCLALAYANAAGIFFFISRVTFLVMFRVGLILILIAIIDYIYQRYENRKQLMMTKKEMKDERKEMEGDPQVKQRMQQLQREMSRRRMMQEVPEATVVVTNPTHLAIAIRYEGSTMNAPQVVAKGKQHQAQRIREIAQEHEVPIVEDKPLARAMYDSVEPGDDIPVEFYNAVAEILAYVYRFQRKQAA